MPNHGSVIIGKDGNNLSGNWVIMVLDSSANNGTIVTETFDSKIKKKIFFTNNMPVKLIKTINGVTKTYMPVKREDLEDTFTVPESVARGRQKK